MKFDEKQKQLQIEGEKIDHARFETFV